MPITIPIMPDDFRWAYDNPTQRQALTLAEQENGYDVELQKPTRKKMNYKLYVIGEWTQYLKSGGASIMFLATDDPDVVIDAIEDIDITNVESGSYLYTISGIYTFYPDMPSPPSSTEYLIKPTTPLIGDLGAWRLLIPSMDTMNGLAQEEVDRVENKLDNHIETTLTELEEINVKLGNVVTVKTAVATPNSAWTSISNHTAQTQTFTIPGLDSTKQYNVDVTPLQGLQDCLSFYGWVSADNTVSVKINNSATGALTPTAQSYKFVITE